MGKKMAVSFANIFMAKIETEIITVGTEKPMVSMMCSSFQSIEEQDEEEEEEVNTFIEQANSYHSTLNFTA